MNDNADRPLNILVISSLLPYPYSNGAIARLFNLYGRLGQKHRVTWISPVWSGTEGDVRGAEEFCQGVIELPQSEERPLPNRGWRGLLMKIVAHLHWERLFVYCFGYVSAPGLYWLPTTPERVNLIHQVVSSSKFDLVVCEFEGNAELVPNEIDAPKVLVLHNVLSVMFSRIRTTYSASWQDRLFFLPELLKVMWYEKQNYRRYNLAITVSELDRKILRARCPSLPIEVVPNGVDIDFYQPGDAPIEAKTLVYIGNYTYPPNADAIRYFHREIFPLIRQKVPDARLWAVGLEPPPELSSSAGVETTGFVADIRPYLARAGVVITPLRVGGGTRLKILDALAMGKAIVSTSLGAEGIDVVHGESILIADGPREFAECVVRLIENPDLRTRIGNNGRRVAEQKYGWESLAAKTDYLFQQAVSDHRTAHKSGGKTHAAG